MSGEYVTRNEWRDSNERIETAMLRIASSSEAIERQITQNRVDMAEFFSDNNHKHQDHYDNHKELKDTVFAYLDLVAVPRWFRFVIVTLVVAGVGIGATLSINHLIGKNQQVKVKVIK